MKLYACVEGFLIREEMAKVSIFERGYLYGDGAFDTMRSYRSEVFRFKDHFERLNKNAKALGIDWEMAPHKLQALILKLLKKNRLKDAYIRVSLSRGCAGLGPKPVKGVEPFLSIITRPSKIYPSSFYKRGVEITIASIRRLSPSSLDGKIKSTNYLNSILAAEDARRKGAFETILLSEDGYIAEGTSSNIFIVKDNKLITPPSFLGTLEGITRKVALEIAERLGIDIEITPFTTYDVYTAEECFLTNTGIEVMPVRLVDKRIIGGSAPGKMTCSIREEFLRLITQIAVKKERRTK